MDAFFAESGGWFHPRPHARSPWSAQMVHGRLLAGLAAAAAEAGHGEPGLQPTRLTVDLFRNTGMEPVRVESTQVRSGRRIKVVDATVHTASGPVARTSLLMLRRTTGTSSTTDTTGGGSTADAGGNTAGGGVTGADAVGGPDEGVPGADGWDAPHPDTLGPPRPSRDGSRPAADIWILDGDRAVERGWGAGRRRAWWRDHTALVDGDKLTPFVRAAIAADFASPLAHFGAGGLGYINADYSLHLSRDPVGELIGLEVAGRSSAEGIGVGHCRLYDEQGPIGTCTTSAIANHWNPTPN